MGIESTRNASPRYLIAALLLTILVFAYNYWSEASSNAGLLLTLEATNKTVDELTAKIKVLEEEKAKATAAATTDKAAIDKAAVDAKKATDDIAKLTAEKTDLDTKLKAEQTNSVTKLTECTTACENKVKEAKAECPTRPREDAAAPVAAPAQ